MSLYEVRKPGFTKCVELVLQRLLSNASTCTTALHHGVLDDLRRDSLPAAAAITTGAKEALVDAQTQLSSFKKLQKAIRRIQMRAASGAFQKWKSFVDGRGLPLAYNLHLCKPHLSCFNLFTTLNESE